MTLSFEHPRARRDQSNDDDKPADAFDPADIRVLVVDDHAFAREIMRYALEAFGFRTVFEASHGQRALEVMAEERIDLVLVDYRMPVMDGIEFTRAVRTGATGDPGMPIVMVSSHTDVDRVRAAVDAGVHEFVAKPFKAVDLYQRIHSALTATRPFISVPGYAGPSRRAGRPVEGLPADLETAA